RKLTPLTTRPSSTSRQGITRVASVMPGSPPVPGPGARSLGLRGRASAAGLGEVRGVAELPHDAEDLLVRPGAGRQHRLGIGGPLVPCQVGAVPALGMYVICAGQFVPRLVAETEGRGVPPVVVELQVGPGGSELPLPRGVPRLLFEPLPPI